MYYHGNSVYTYDGKNTIEFCKLYNNNEAFYI